MIPLVGASLADLAIVAVMGMLIAMLMLRSHRYFSRQAKDSSPMVRIARPDPKNTTASPQLSNEMARCEVHMHELARDLSATLDSKMSALEHFIREADRAAARLERALAAAADHHDAELELQASQAAGLSQLPDEAETLDSPSSQSNATENLPSGATENPKYQQRYQEIYTLADYGLDSAKIAQRVGIPVGEVELILGIRDTR